MRAHELHGSTRSVDDEYEDQEAEYEEDDQEQEDTQPSKEELEILKLREKFKERERQRLRKENGSALGAPHEKKSTSLPNDTFGSFFGPSRTVIARRVIDEATAVQHKTAAKVSKPSSGSQNGKAHDSRATETMAIKLQQQPKRGNEVKLKVEKLKQNRDYSFILSEDAELPAPSKEPTHRNISVPKSDARSVQVQSKSKPSTHKPSRPVSSVHKDGNSVSSNKQSQDKMRVTKTAPASKHNPSSGVPRKSIGINGGSGPDRPKASLSKGPIPMDRAPPVKVLSKSGPSVPKAPVLKPQSSAQRVSAEQRRQPQGLDKPPAKILSKQSVSSAKPQLKPPKSMPPRAVNEDRPKKRPKNKYSDEEEDAEGGEDYLSMIRKIMGYNPNKYRNMDDDDSDMEVGFNQIQAEERKSARIAREEDERELALIEEEERRERERKRQKLKHKQR